MRTATAETLVPACPAVAHAAAWALARRLWAVTDDDVVTVEVPEQLVHGVRVDGETGCWLSWTFAAAGPSLTRVRLSHADAAVREDAPDPDLDAVLGLLLAETATYPRVGDAS